MTTERAPNATLASGRLVRCAALRAGSLSVLLAAACLAWAPWSTAAHVALRSSEPAANDTLPRPPAAIRLEFTEVVELRLARLSVSAADSTNVPLTPVRAADSTGRAIVADVPPTLGAGTYHVRWAVTSRDSHTIRGEFRFTVLGGPPDTLSVRGTSEPAATAATSVAASDTVSMADDEFDARAPAYTVIRWLTYAGLLGVIGGLFFRVGVVPAAQRHQAGDDAVTTGALHRALASARFAASGAAILLLIAAALRLVAQVRTVFGETTLDPAMVSPLLGGTAWGRAWIAQVVAAAVMFAIAARRAELRRDARAAPIEIVGALALVTLAVSAGVSGHPAAASPVFLAVGTDAVHLLAAGGWIGTLAYVALAGIPATAGMEPERRPRLVRDIVTAFSRMALVCVAAILATGALSSWLQLRSVSALWTTPYGRVLMVKLGLVAVVAAAGAYNWRVATPRLLSAGGVRRIRTVMLAELLFAVCVLGATAVLTATPPPTDAMETAIGP